MIADNHAAAAGEEELFVAAGDIPAADVVEEGAENNLGVDDEDGDDDGDDNASIEEAAPDQPPRVLGPHDPGRMTLSGEERRRALDIKHAVEQTSDVDNLTDFQYAQLALIDMADIDGAVDRAMHVQCFRQEYGLMDTCQDGCRVLTELITMLPRAYLSLTYNYQTGTYAIIYDITGMNMDTLNTEENVRTCLSGTYYFLHALNPDMEAIRRGYDALGECEGFDWSKHINVRIYRRLLAELVAVYPMSLQTIKHFNCSVLFNLQLAMVRSILPPGIRSKLVSGYRSEIRLDAIFLTPSVDVANQRLLHRLHESLERRYGLENSFTLDFR